MPKWCHLPLKNVNLKVVIVLGPDVWVNWTKVDALI